jgi:spore coat polysaccharide biosynthesis predicted glycosyltransferase SpsG
MKVAILTAANGKIGGGHLVRMKELQNVFSEYFKEILLYSN